MVGVVDARTADVAREIERSFPVIRDEFLRLDAPMLPLHRYLGAGPEYTAALLGFERNGWTPSWQVGSADPNFTWLTYAIKSGSWSHPETAARCPQTVRLVDHPVVDVAAFSLFRGVSVLGPHFHPELDAQHPIVHLGIDVEPGKSFLVVDGTNHEEREGELVTFNGNHEHYAFNASVRDRIILYLELDLTKV